MEDIETNTRGWGEREVCIASQRQQIKLKTSCDVPAPLNQRRTTTFDQRAPTLIPRWSRYLNQNISQKCSRDDHKMTLGGLHGRETVHSSGVGAPMVPRGQVIHHQQRCKAQQRVVPTISQLSRSGEFHLKVLRGGGVRASQRSSECYIRRRRR